MALPGRRSPINRMYLPARAHLKTYVRTYTTVYVWCTMHRVYSSNNRGYIHFHPRFTHPHSCAGQHSVALFSLSSTSFLDIKAFNIERRIAMRPDSARGQSVLSGGREFRDKFSAMREYSRFDKSRRCAPRLPFAVSRTLLTLQ